MPKKESQLGTGSSRRSADIDSLKEASPEVNPDVITASGVGRYIALMDHQVTGLIDKVVVVEEIVHVDNHMQSIAPIIAESEAINSLLHKSLHHAQVYYLIT